MCFAATTAAEARSIFPGLLLPRPKRGVNKSENRPGEPTKKCFTQTDYNAAVPRRCLQRKGSLRLVARPPRSRCRLSLQPLETASSGGHRGASRGTPSSAFWRWCTWSLRGGRDRNSNEGGPAAAGRRLQDYWKQTVALAGDSGVSS